MTSIPNRMDDSVREKILTAPETVLADQDLMRALIAANDRAMGKNIVDLRGVAMERLETRLDRLEDTHRSVIAAAYENLAGTNQVHRAILRMLDPVEFDIFLRDLNGEVADILRVDFVRLVLETPSANDPAAARLEDVLTMAPEGFVESYISGGRSSPDRKVTLRQTRPDSQAIYGEASDWIQSEACLVLDFGEGRSAGMLVMGSEDPHQFSPNQGTDLLAFFAGVFERSMRKWLS